MGSLTVHVTDRHDHPVSGKRVFCNFPHSFTHRQAFTDDRGVADFKKVPTGIVEVFVEREKVEVSVGQNDLEEVTVCV